MESEGREHSGREGRGQGRKEREQWSKGREGQGREGTGREKRDCVGGGGWSRGQREWEIGVRAGMGWGRQGTE